LQVSTNASIWSARSRVGSEAVVLEQSPPPDREEVLDLVKNGACVGVIRERVARLLGDLVVGAGAKASPDANRRPPLPSERCTAPAEPPTAGRGSWSGSDATIPAHAKVAQVQALLRRLTPTQPHFWIEPISSNRPACLRRRKPGCRSQRHIHGAHARRKSDRTVPTTKGRVRSGRRALAHGRRCSITGRHLVTSVIGRAALARETKIVGAGWSSGDRGLRDRTVASGVPGSRTHSLSRGSSNVASTVTSADASDPSNPVRPVAVVRVPRPAGRTKRAVLAHAAFARTEFAPWRSLSARPSECCVSKHGHATGRGGKFRLTKCCLRVTSDS